tara:strand:- start:4089 stop:4274 length:186 start_codon:yes stop_codon:yes gene_type:complete
MTQPKSYESYRQLADDILTNKFCNENLPQSFRKDVLARIIIDIYWQGWDDHAKDVYGERGV